jgi:hypothetical protein
MPGSRMIFSVSAKSFGYGRFWIHNADFFVLNYRHTVAYSKSDPDSTRIHKVFGYKDLTDKKDTQNKFYVLKSNVGVQI